MLIYQLVNLSELLKHHTQSKVVRKKSTHINFSER